MDVEGRFFLGSSHVASPMGTCPCDKEQGSKRFGLKRLPIYIYIDI